MSEQFQKQFRIELADKLGRLKQTLPLPVDRFDIYKAAFPGPLGVLFSSNQISPRGTPTMIAGNVWTAVTRADYVTYDLHPYIERVIWVTYPHEVVCGGLPLQLPDSMKKRLQAWGDSVIAMEDEIESMRKSIYRMAGIITRPVEFAVACPKLVNAVPNAMRGVHYSLDSMGAKSKATQGIKARVAELIPDDAMDRLALTLTKAIMLPEGSPTAWVHD
jgi:hypothetical protein